jgi:hypothetical protein
MIVAADTIREYLRKIFMLEDVFFSSDVLT